MKRAAPPKPEVSMKSPSRKLLNASIRRLTSPAPEPTPAGREIRLKLGKRSAAVANGDSIDRDAAELLDDEAEEDRQEKDGGPAGV
jgi:hypothetical protein